MVWPGTKQRMRLLRRQTWIAVCVLAYFVLQTACFSEIEPEPYYGPATKPPLAELRWSAGGLPQIFDPARANHAPDTDAVRALFEGLTDYNPQTLEVVPGVAQRWEVVGAEGREWTFFLRKNAKWSNGETVKASDFVRSWQRVQRLGAESPNYPLFENIIGANPALESTVETALPDEVIAAATPEATPLITSTTPTPQISPTPVIPEPPRLAVEAVGDFVLKVKLRNPAPNFPALVAHTVFRPVYKTEEFPTRENPEKSLVSNGPFRLAKRQKEAVTLERAPQYWDAAAVSLERVQMVAAKDAEAALSMYRNGTVDVVTNAGFEPLALKLLKPYKDFRRSTFSALNYYQFNPARPPFDKPTVRQALALALDRDRIVADVLAGANEPARRFLPGPANSAPALTRDVARARALMNEAGYPDGAGFPKIRLLINRNEQQKQLARAITQMWRRELGLETEIIILGWSEYQTSLQSGEFDIARRSVILPTTEAATNLWLLFAPVAKPETVAAATSPTPVASPEINLTPTATPEVARAEILPTPFPIPQNEAEALNDLPAVPVYFASSYALVKPYVVGFDTNLLDAPSLKQVRLDAAWQPPPPTSKDWFGASSNNKMLP